ncbi:MAG: glycosyltransferase [Pseudomonadota bacterium]|nr:glycosyltransferase [Pseudomonadota bacterium]
MRILHVYKAYLPESQGGSEQVIRQLCRGTAVLGVVNEVLTLTRERSASTTLFEGVIVHRMVCDIEIASTGFARRLIGKLAQMAPQFDLIHYHYPWPFMDLAHFAARVRTPALVSYHADIVRQKLLINLYRPLQRRFLRDVSRIVTTSPNYFASSPTLQRYRDKVEMITYGLDQNSYPSPDAELLARWRAICGPRFFLFVGVLRYYKGVRFLLDAVAGTDLPVVIVGSGPAERRLQRQARRLGLDQVRFVGAVSDADKAALLRLCHALVFPSNLRTESFGISLLEGAMFGKPLISCEIGSGNSYVNLHDETGLVVAPSDASALRTAMQSLWNDPLRAAAMGRAAYARYQQMFTAATMAQAYVALYRSVLDEHAARVVSRADKAAIPARLAP